MSIAGANVLEVLSADVFLLILDEVKNADFGGVKALRLVSRAMNELAEPLTFSSITIKIVLESAPYIEHQLSTLASGNSPATRWTKRLTILDLVPVMLTAMSQYDKLQGEARETMLACQKRFLIPAIQALSNVEFASFRIPERGPDAEVIRALSQCPKLRDLSLSLPVDFESRERVPQLETFANLRVLKLTSFVISASAIYSIGRIVSRCLALEDLSLWNNRGQQNTQNLDIIFSGSMPSPSFVPSLTKLTVRNTPFTISALSVPYLRSLVHLDVQMDEGNIDASLWQTLALNGIQIRYFAVYPLDAAAIRYLASYEGLNEFHLRGHSGQEAKACPDEVFHTVLSRHRQSLHKLSFSSLNFRSWSITDNYLECVLKCTALQSLILLYHYPADKECPGLDPQEKLSMDLATLLTRITESLTSLQTLKLSPVRQYPSFACGKGIIKYISAMHESFEREICGATITCARTPTFQMQETDRLLGPFVLSPSIFDPNNGRFNPVEVKDKYRLRFPQ
ncbi:hypothetical protein EST38_g8754 [Candolleomyces aberdarensis]|uniref:F-box/LRR-repeat protein 15/At3g58940/PEG3-like LRR domain-containing protein n=1 Tax=Candolleomyces aberdarensis TaxID=2316362 RepID=A0A4Q2DEK9_9AGAR|nr:hypothetical protein EST38_g8754 [Candolleomyces aberdarensis]